jgi:hypothetical protein
LRAKVGGLQISADAKLTFAQGGYKFTVVFLASHINALLARMLVSGNAL